MKRLLDIVVTFILLILLFPILLICCMIVKFSLGSPIFFKQQRPGLEEKPFYVYKLRTMNSTVDEEGELLADHIRLTKMGLFLRKYSLDELPQLVNVLKGDMSLVGPRPLLMEYLTLYTKEQETRHSVRPGITGWAQVNGRNNLSWEEKLALDTWYVRNQTMGLDLKILLLTALKVVKKEGVSKQGHVTTDKFTGSKDVI
ncbi:sugar transferase [Priestia flexa]|jgi:sugar transferase EpsL|uniref:Sugar transferase n=1 Tax=Priestia flexa TaxID=86664 RepID=A0A8I1MEW7_9BACI|nr:sugar transferase [Priestia flexa]MBN8251484.1 sugar transferase [Priestia flexa]MBN8434252.1 sugar transferase [Priestia flexa]MCA0966964.1 sugar transferase [Priestia flexa]QCS53310.1 sugar transferase [Priestia flexa]RIV13638.1 sugar transferase [Priestia flexa]